MAKTVIVVMTPLRYFLVLCTLSTLTVMLILKTAEIDIWIVVQKNAFQAAFSRYVHFNEPDSSHWEYFTAFEIPSCRFPYLNSNDESIRKLIKHPRRVKCVQVQPDFAWLDRDSLLRFDWNALYSNLMWGEITECYYRYIGGSLGRERLSVAYLSKWTKIDNYLENMEPSHDQLELICNSSQRTIYRNTFAGISELPKSDFTTETSKDKSLHILVLDSTSLNQFNRHMPRVKAFLQSQMGAEFLYGYMKVGDNSMPNLLPVLAGKRIHDQSPDLPSDFSEEKEKVQIKMDHLPWIWNIYQSKGCVTMFNDDVMEYGRGVFHYPYDTVSGFTISPTHHYYRPFWVNIRKDPVSNSSRLCHGNEPLHRIQLDIVERFFVKYKGYCKFSFSFFTAISHDLPEDLEQMDDDLVEFLIRMYSSNQFVNSTVIIMGDHGHRVSAFKFTYIGKLEERMPLFSIALPEAFKTEHKNAVLNLRHNKHRLTSNFDIYETLLDLAEGPTRQQSRRGISLFDTIPLNRTCLEAEITENFCTCLYESSDEPLTNELVEKFQRLIADTANQANADHHDCMLFERAEIIEVVPRQVNQMVLHAIRQQTQADLKELSRTLSASTTHYEITAKLYPSNWSISAIVQYYSVLNVARINGPIRLPEPTQFSDCWMEIRPLCACKK